MTQRNASVPVEGGRFALIGGASLVGVATAELLLAKRAQKVVIFDNFSFGVDANVAHLAADPRVVVHRGDIRQSADLNAALSETDGVINLAALMTISMNQNPRLGLEVNVTGAQNVIDACCGNGVRKLVFSSSNAVYGYGPQVAGDLVESTPFHGHGASPASALYGASKIIGEQLCRDAYRRHGLDYLIVRYSTVYGERQHSRAANSQFILDALAKIERGEAPTCIGTGTETKHYVYVGDVARANVMALEADRSDEAMNISGPKPTTSREALELLLEVAGSELRPIFVAPTEKDSLLAVGGAFSIDHRKALDVIGWAPEVDMREGLTRLVAWRRQANAVAG